VSHAADAVEDCLLDRAQGSRQRELGVQGDARLGHHAGQSSLVRPRGGVDQERVAEEHVARFAGG
jgi:hypothetical protein